MYNFDVLFRAKPTQEYTIGSKLESYLKENKEEFDCFKKNVEQRKKNLMKNENMATKDVVQEILDFLDDIKNSKSGEEFDCFRLRQFRCGSDYQKWHKKCEENKSTWEDQIEAVRDGNVCIVENMLREAHLPKKTKNYIYWKEKNPDHRRARTEDVHGFNKLKKDTSDFIQNIANDKDMVEVDDFPYKLSPRGLELFQKTLRYIFQKHEFKNWVNPEIAEKLFDSPRHNPLGEAVSIFKTLSTCGQGKITEFMKKLDSLPDDIKEQIFSDNPGDEFPLQAKDVDVGTDETALNNIFEQRQQQARGAENARERMVQIRARNAQKS